MSSSMFNNNSCNISISVSDEDEFDELGRVRVRVRRKRKKSKNLYLIKNNELPRRVFKFLLRYWMALILFTAVGLLLFEASRISNRPTLEVKSKLDIKTTTNTKEKSKSVDWKNLDRLDPPRCLKLLPNEELEHLDIPVYDDFGGAVKKLLYMSKKDAQQHEGNNTHTGRFNLFTGYQTLDQRGKSFEVSDTAEIHCGFYSENGGFKISDEDKSYMQMCKAVVSTCAFGGGDDLYQPIGMSDTSLQKVCYVAFWDEITLAAQESNAHRVGEDHFIGKWRIVVVRDLPFTDQRLNGKIPKVTKVFEL